MAIDLPNDKKERFYYRINKDVKFTKENMKPRIERYKRRLEENRKALEDNKNNKGESIEK